MKDNDESTHYPANEMSQMPSVIVKFHNEIELPYIDNLEKYIVENNLAPWEELVSKFPGISIQRIYISLSPQRIQELEDQAFEKIPISERPNLLKFFRIDSPPDTDRYALVEVIKEEWKIIELAYVPLSLDVPPDTPSHSAGSQSFQYHLDPSPGSIGAEEAWLTSAADGRGMQFIDLERGWILDHQNFINPATSSSVFSVADPATSQLNPDPNLRAHGTSVLGTVAAPDFGGPTMQTIGIAFRSSGRVISINRTGGGEKIHNAIMVAVNLLAEGDVLLIEAQAKDLALKLWPVEVNILEYQEIRTATNLNRVVIEPAGNGMEHSGLNPGGNVGNDLDMYPSPAPEIIHILDRGKSAEFMDSGAIMVGSARSILPHSRMERTGPNSESNYGSRVDCYAWGENIFTTGGPSTSSIDAQFGSTSGASAMIAGAALIVQGLAKAHLKGDNPTNKTFLPGTLRGILGSFDPITRQPWRRQAPDDNPPYGTKSNDPLVDLIGVMPDLIKIIDKKLGLGPDIFLRDFLGDTGDPHAGLISSSPDVIVRNTQMLDYNGIGGFGQGSPNQNLDGLGEMVIKNGSPKYIYARVTNRGETPAQNVQVTVYWSEVSTLLTPGMWNMIGSSTIASIPAGAMRVCEIVWSDGNLLPNPIPPSGHYCFVGIAGNTRDPAPIYPAAFASWNDYYSFIRQFNNVTWCNFNVQPMPPPPPSPGNSGGGGSGGDGGGGNNENVNMIILPFLATGAQFEDLQMLLEMESQLPEGAKLWLEGSEGFMAALNEGRDVNLEDTKENAIKRLKVNPHGRDTFMNISFPGNLREQMRLIVDIPKDSRKNNYEIFVRQLHNNEEIGRITWRLVPPVQ